MRTIKFRAWDGEKMIFDSQRREYDDYFTLDLDGSFYAHTRTGDEYYNSYADELNKKQYTLMQFTGLIDKNGKEIYEGEIVRILYTDWASKGADDTRTLEQYLIDIAHLGTIVFEYDRFCVSFGQKGTSSINPGTHGYIEIIGNIYENPELI